jgi:4-amino-4-deoxy-L-arabinose transferase-like glycosyltransferase
LQALSFKFAGISDFTARFPSVIFQLWSVLLMYLIPYKLTRNKYIGLISAAVFW